MVAKGKYEQWLTKESLLLLEGWARDELTDEQIARKAGVKRQTLCQWKKDHPDISDTLKRGKEVVDYQVENALLENAKSGNVTAQIFWLKNRRPDKWRDKRDDTSKATDDKVSNLLSAMKKAAQEARDESNV